MSRTAITLKLKMRWFPDEASSWAEKLYTDIDLAPLMPGKDKNFGVCLFLNFRTWWRHVQAKNILVTTYSVMRNITVLLFVLSLGPDLGLFPCGDRQD